MMSHLACHTPRTASGMSGGASPAITQATESPRTSTSSGRGGGGGGSGLVGAGETVDAGGAVGATVEAGAGPAARTVVGTGGVVVGWTVVGTAAGAATAGLDAAIVPLLASGR